jgi:hypothetical protein
MKRDDELIGLVESYLDEYEGLTPLPDSVRASIRAELPKTKQIRPRPGLTRYIPMSNGMRIGLAAVVVAIAALVGYGLLGNNNIGPPTGTPTPSPGPSVGDAETQLPAELQHVFFGPTREIPGPGIENGNALALDISGSRFQMRLGTGYTAFLSRATLAAPGQLKLVSTGYVGCQLEDEGIYPYTLSPGGSVLTIGEGTDDCAARSVAVLGEWFTAQCRNPDDECLGNLDPGTYSSHYFEPRLEIAWAPRFGALTVTVPEGWANYADVGDVYGLTPRSDYEAFDGADCYDCPGTRDVITVLSDPGAATEDCLEEENVPGVGFSADGLFGWISQHRGLIVTGVEERTINGRAATSFLLETAADWTGTCGENPFVAVPIFYRLDGYHWALGVGAAYHVTLMDLGGGHTVAVVVDSANDDELEAFVDQAIPIIETLDFPEP